ncbi:MAG: phosphohistidine phosphatase SixA [Acidobacteria bacterium]|nr:MAG: phosphohistidine phosphatase SixA [Acidobacteriota bacterium]
MAAKEPAQATTPPKRDHELYIMRHGIAVTRGAGSFADDSKRPLTPEGKMKVQEIAKGLLRLGFEVDWILTSPLVRAVETAEIVSDALRPSVPTDFVEALKPGGSPEAVITFLARHLERRRILVVGHEPDLSEMAARLVGAGRNANLGFKKAGCCLIRFTEFPPKAPGELVWWLTPRIMRKLA